MQSVFFLLRYEEDLLKAAQDHPSVSENEGKTLIGQEPSIPAQTHMQWTAPVRGTAKLNSDASFLPDSGRSWVGAVARDHNGQVILSVGRQVANLNSVEEAEMHAALFGLQALVNVYTGPVVLEMDCKAMIEELMDTGQSRSPCYGVIRDVKSVLAGFASHKCSFAGRNCNKLAHELAATARRAGDFFMIDSVPASLIPLMWSECKTPLE
jgi:ribonuclease HI